MPFMSSYLRLFSFACRHRQSKCKCPINWVKFDWFRAYICPICDWPANQYKLQLKCASWKSYFLIVCDCPSGYRCQSDEKCHRKIYFLLHPFCGCLTHSFLTFWWVSSMVVFTCCWSIGRCLLVFICGSKVDLIVGSCC